MNVKGKLIYKADENQISADFKKRDFVVETIEEMYPQKILIQLIQDKCRLLEMFNEGDIIDVSINIKGREWISPQGEVRYFNTIEAWKIDKIGSSEQLGTPVKKIVQKASQEDENDDLPF
jgi:hypothetical protein